MREALAQAENDDILFSTYFKTLSLQKNRVRKFEDPTEEKNLDYYSESERDYIGYEGPFKRMANKAAEMENSVQQSNLNIKFLLQSSIGGLKRFNDSRGEGRQICFGNLTQKIK